jgi:hypothetical protein
VSYSPSDNDAADTESDKQGTVVLYHCSRGEGREGGDFVTALSSSGQSLQKEKKDQFCVLWRACVEFNMFCESRSDEVMQLCNSLMTNTIISDRTENHQAANASSLVKRNEDLEMERTQRMIVLESALAAGLGSVLANYVLAQSENWSTFSRGTQTSLTLCCLCSNLYSNSCKIDRNFYHSSR